MRLPFLACSPSPFSWASWALVCLAVGQSGGSRATASPLISMTRQTSAAGPPETQVRPGETIILLHGMGRTRLSMSWLARQFELAGYEVGVIAGRVSLNPLFSSWIKGPDDGKVSVARAAMPGCRDLLVIDRSHTFLMRSREVANQALHFIAHGTFHRPPP